MAVARLVFECGDRLPTEGEFFRSLPWLLAALAELPSLSFSDDSFVLLFNFVAVVVGVVVPLSFGVLGGTTLSLVVTVIMMLER